MADQEYPYYSPLIGSKKFVTYTELNNRLRNFFTAVAPKKASVAELQKFFRIAETQGVLALEQYILEKVGYPLDEFDNSEEDWYRINDTIIRFYRKYNPSMTTQEVGVVCASARTKGIRSLDTKLKKKYGQSMTEFGAESVMTWRDQWNKVLIETHKEQLSYELRRFYGFIETTRKVLPPGELGLAKLVTWGINNGREAVNERLQEKYLLTLDDVQTIPGNSDRERTLLLRIMLIEYYQKHDPELLKLPQGKQARKSKRGLAELENLYDDAEKGIVFLEELNEKLQEKYGIGLPDRRTNLKEKLKHFFEENDPEKKEEDIDNLVAQAATSGIGIVNEILVEEYGKGIDTSHLDFHVVR